jgi:hypothetical protein
MSPPVKRGRKGCAAARGADGAARRSYRVQGFQNAKSILGNSLPDPGFRSRRCKTAEIRNAGPIRQLPEWLHRDSYARLAIAEVFNEPFALPPGFGLRREAKRHAALGMASRIIAHT